MSKNGKVTSNGKAKLTIKQRIFIKEYLNNNGNGTQAALIAYNTKSESTANAIAVENLQKPLIKKMLKQGLTNKGLTVDQIVGNIERIAKVKVKPSAKVVLNANLSLLKVLGAYPDQKQGGNVTNIQFNVEKMDYKELKKQLTSIDGSIKHLMRGASTP